MRVLILVCFLLVAAFPVHAKFALIHKTEVVQVEEYTFPVVPPLLWVRIPDGVTIFPGWRYDGGFVAPVPRPKADQFNAAISADPKFRALVRALAEDKGKTEQQIIDWLKSKL
jgi:hypothetical protein